MTSVSNYTNYKSFMKAWVKGLAQKSGKLRDLADFLRVHPSRLSRILRGYDHPTHEQAFLIAQFLGLGEIEASYFVELVNLERATNSTYKMHTQKKLKTLKEKLVSPTETHEFRQLTPAEEKIYYSTYEYGAVWLSSMVEGKNDLVSITQSLDLGKKTAEGIAKFLVEKGLCKWDEDRLVPGPRFLTIGADSAHIESFLSNWRTHGINVMSARKPKNMFYSEPMAVGAESIEQIREILRKAIEDIRKSLLKQKADKVLCLNIDFFDV